MLKFERKWLSYTPQAVYYIFNHDGKEEIVELDIEARLLAGQLCVANSWNDTEAEELVAREAIVENIIPVDDNGLKKKVRQVHGHHPCIQNAFDARRAGRQITD
ncbi:hypothetical protein [Sulfoacidibacillus ferrooxidans]|uniref:Uncharacterized protein n=1 Tax=Sulfoacidibacillus ferrooxidans TaxID=2005001 RepID=A0A9X1VAV0_9BACL|nr:hypothetical protein [Sulfoacidibacillus ferrooxidans]MCI0184593.1 hypothetical protein [Sulfoacidibacillus ferrooxidans]